MAATLFGRYNSRSKIGSANAAVLPEPAASTAPVTSLHEIVMGVQGRHCNRLHKAWEHSCAPTTLDKAVRCMSGLKLAAA